MRFITLTLADDGKPLADRIDRLYASFRRLRETKLWSENVVAGIATMEVTLGKKRHWHTHLHVLVCGEFIPQRQLSACWEKATGDSIIVDIQAVPDRDKVAGYVASYIAKPPPLHTLTEEEICEYAAAMSGRRLLLTVGKRPTVVSAEDDAEDTRQPSEHLVDINKLHAQESAGIEQVSHACDILARMSPALALALDRPPPCPTMPPVTGQEFLFALHACMAVKGVDFGTVNAHELDQLRRRIFGVAQAPPPGRITQAHFQYGGPGS